MNMGGMNISMIQVPKKKAKKMDAEVQELLLSSVVPLNAAVPKGDKNIFIMKTVKGKWSATLFEGTGQKIEKIDDKSVRVIVDQSPSKNRVREEIDLKPFLSSSVYLDTEDLLIQKLAKKGKGKKHLRNCQETYQFVFRYMTNKNYGSGLPPPVKSQEIKRVIARSILCYWLPWACHGYPDPRCNRLSLC